MDRYYITMITILIIAHIYPAVVAFSPILPSQYQSNIIGHHQKHQVDNLQRLYFRDAVANRTEESLDTTSTTIPTNIIAVTDEQPTTRRTNGILNRKPYPEEEEEDIKDIKPKSSNRSINPKRKSAQRLLKAKRLLEMAQVSPSQRLEIMQQDAAAAAQQKSSTSNAQTNNNNTTKSFTNINKQVDDPSTSTVVPMGSYSMRFGGYGSLEEELYSLTEMRMAGKSPCLYCFMCSL